MMAKVMDEQAIRALYDQFEKKDMTFHDFRREFLAQSDPNAIARDAQGIVSRRHLARSRRAEIDKLTHGQQ